MYYKKWGGGGRGGLQNNNNNKTVIVYSKTVLTVQSFSCTIFDTLKLQHVCQTGQLGHSQNSVEMGSEGFELSRPSQPVLGTRSLYTA